MKRLPVVALATALRNEPLFTAAECAGGLWMMILTIKAARTFFGGTTARLTPALLFALLAAMSSFYILKNLGVIPPAIFRFIMFM